MSLLAVGLNHRTASVGLRERLSFAPEMIASALRDICEKKLAEEAVLLTTCNRTELYLADAAQPRSIYEWLSDDRRVELSTLKHHSYCYRDKHASKHLFRVASGLDSLALGEPQILGQVKSAYQTAVAQGGIKQTLNRLFQEAFYVAKHIRSDTKLGEHSVSIPYAAAKLSEQFFDDHQALTVLIIGAGQMGTLAAKIFNQLGVGKLLIANRSISKAQNLAMQINGYALPLASVQKHLHEADIIISTTGRGAHLIDASMIVAAQRKRRMRTQLLLDLAVPRDIDPAVKKLSNSYLFDVDELQGIIEQNQHIRQQAAAQAESLIDEYNQHFHEWLQLRRHHYLIKGVHDYAQRQRELLTKTARKRLAKGDDAMDVIDELATKLSKKLIHHPSILIRQASDNGQVDLLDAIKSIYHID